MTYQKINGLLLIVICYFVVACGPTHKYYLIPPSTLEGKSCISQCQTVKLECAQQADKEVVKCELEARRFCDNRIPCNNRPVCMPDYHNCEENYFRCYSDCGGTVEKKKL